VAVPISHQRLLKNYRMPAEWEPHVATYLVWPHNLDTWPCKFELVPPVFAGIAATLAQFEQVRILVCDPAHIPAVREMISAASAPAGEPVRMERIELLPIATNDSWIRDYGPIFLNRISGSENGPMQQAVDWRFNSWGGKYGPCDLDDVVPQRLAEHYRFDVMKAAMVLEGGSFDVNGAGFLLTTESCLLNSNRNPSMDRQEVGDSLRVYLGVERVLWLGEGIAGDDTDGHVDDLARFTAPNTIVTVIEQDPGDANYAPLQDNLRRLRAMRNRDGEAFTIAILPMPPPLYHDDVRLPASYANFYIANGAVLMPSFGCATDEVARKALAQLFPNRRIITIPSADLVWGLGAIHCVTQQHPAVPAQR
jgi:agmatine deiminase